ncbi:MAG TPA: ribonuclease E/G, partial [Clostridiaceae bacterium]|nr:ribonuclease E/G [Clostridiaceae bacterium]
MGLIVRTAAEGVDEENFGKDIEFLLKLWDSIRKQERSGTVPRCLYKDLNLVSRIIRDNFTNDINKLVINDRREYERVLELLDVVSPQLKNRVEYYSKDYDLFDFYNINTKISSALSRKVWLKCGGYLIIDRTEALTVIDVNTGKYTGKDNLESTVLRTNVEAAEEIARQLRLRDIGGIIIIDFIDMRDSEHQKIVLDTLKCALKRDRAKTTVVGMTGLGLIEMTRKKVNQELSSIMNADCHFCGGTGKVLSYESIARIIEKRIGQYSARTNSKSITVEVNPAILLPLKGSNNENLTRMEEAYGKKIQLKPSDNLKYDEVKIKDVDTYLPVC